MRLQSFWECESLTVRLAFKSHKLGPAIYQCNFEFLHFSAYTFRHYTAFAYAQPPRTFVLFFFFFRLIHMPVRSNCVDRHIVWVCFRTFLKIDLFSQHFSIIVGTQGVESNYLKIYNNNLAFSYMWCMMNAREKNKREWKCSAYSTYKLILLCSFICFVE